MIIAMTDAQRKHPSAGFTSLEIIGGLLVLFMLMPVLYSWVSQGLTEVEKKAVASHFNTVTTAAREYGRSFAPTLLATSTANSGPTLSIADLQAEGLLNNFANQNAWGQGYQIFVRQPTPGALRLIIMTSGGRTSVKPDFINATVPSTAALAGGHAGFIPSGLLPGQSPAQLQGAYGGWALDLASVAIPSPGPGHLGCLSDFSAKDLAHDFLYRVAVPGKPELNEMWTELDMTGHAVRNVEEIHLTPREISSETCLDTETSGRIFLDTNQGLYLCRDGKMQIIADSGNSMLMQQATLAQHGDLIDKPICAPGTETTPQIFVSPSIVAAGNQAPPLTALQAWALNYSDTQWQVQLRLLTADKKLGWIYPASQYGRAIVFTTCGK